ELFDDEPVFLELLAAGDATMRDMEDDVDPTFGNQVIIAASLQECAHLHHAEDPVGASAGVEGAFPDHAPFDPVTQAASGGDDGVSSSASAHGAFFPDYDPADNGVIEGDALMLDNDGVAIAETGTPALTT
ncbi:unnamed protein product, partial [Prorocentrum cordatum]